MSGSSTMDRLSKAVQRALGDGRLRGAALYPAEKSLAALRRLAQLFPVELTVYVGSSAAQARNQVRGALTCEFRVAPVQEVALRECLLDSTEDSGEVAISSLRGGYHFLLRGELLSLETVYRVCETAIDKSSGLFFSHVALIGPKQREAFLVSDGLLNPRPDTETRLGIIRNAARVWSVVGTGPARVALLAAVEEVNPGMPVTLESARAAEAARKVVSGAAVEGPLSFDVALDEGAASDKGASGEVAGKANVLIGSTVEVSNGIYTALTLLPKVRSASAVVGGRAPLALPFPSAGTDTIVDSVCLAALIALGRGRGSGTHTT